MSKTFMNEYSRKDRLFTAWIDHLRFVHSEFNEDDFEEFYEGMAIITELSRNTMGLYLEDGRNIRHIPITPLVSDLSLRLDHVFVVLGLSDRTWWPLDVISIGSIVDGETKGMHVTVNPLHMANLCEPAGALH